MGLADFGRIDEVIHGRMRLGIMVYLADVEAADFTELKTVLEATQGNLSVHIKKLEEAGYVADQTAETVVIGGADIDLGTRGHGDALMRTDGRRRGVAAIGKGRGGRRGARNGAKGARPFRVSRLRRGVPRGKGVEPG